MSGIGRLRQVVLDCPDTMALAEFYRAILGWEILSVNLEAEDGLVVIGEGTQVRLCFQRATDLVPPTWPSGESRSSSTSTSGWTTPTKQRNRRSPSAR